MSGLSKVLNKMIHYRVQNAIFDKVLNMPLVLKWQGYKKLCVNCILETHVILNMSQVLIIPRFCMYLGILVC